MSEPTMLIKEVTAEDGNIPVTPVVIVDPDTSGIPAMPVKLVGGGGGNKIKKFTVTIDKTTGTHEIGELSQEEFDNSQCIIFRINQETASKYGYKNDGLTPKHIVELHAFRLKKGQTIGYIQMFIFDEYKLANGSRYTAYIGRSSSYINYSNGILYYEYSSSTVTPYINNQIMDCYVIPFDI